MLILSEHLLLAETFGLSFHYVMVTGIAGFLSDWSEQRPAASELSADKQHEQEVVLYRFKPLIWGIACFHCVI